MQVGKCIAIVKDKFEGMMEGNCRGVVFGLRNMGKYTAISNDTLYLQYQTMILNERLANALKLTGADEFRWNCIRIIKITPRIDILDASLSGVIVNVAAGRDSDGSFSARGEKVTSDGFVFIWRP